MCNKSMAKLLSRHCSPSSYPKLLGNHSYLFSNFKCSTSFGASNFTHYSVLPRKQNTSPHPKENSFYNDCEVRFNFNKNVRPISFNTVGFRPYCTKKDQPLPTLMDLPQVVWPSMFKTIRNWILSNFIIMRYFDSEFNLPDFVSGSKQAVETVSGIISRGEVDSLDQAQLVTPEVIAQVRDNLNVFTLKQRQEFAIKVEDIYFCFPYEVGIMFPDEDSNSIIQRRYVEITMCYHAILGLKEMKEQGVSPPVNLGLMPEYQDKIFICNYRFIREFTKGMTNNGWTINAINHFKPAVVV